MENNLFFQISPSIIMLLFLKAKLFIFAWGLIFVDELPWKGFGDALFDFQRHILYKSRDQEKYFSSPQDFSTTINICGWSFGTW